MQSTFSDTTNYHTALCKRVSKNKASTRVFIRAPVTVAYDQLHHKALMHHDNVGSTLREHYQKPDVQSTNKLSITHQILTAKQHNIHTYTDTD